MTASKVRLALKAILLFSGAIFLGNYAERIEASVATIDRVAQNVGH